MKKRIIATTRRSLSALGIGSTLLASAAMAGAPGVTIVGKPAAASQTSFEVALPLRNVDQHQDLLADLHDPASPQYHHLSTRCHTGGRKTAFEIPAHRNSWV